VIEEADAAKKEGDERVILFNLSGHGFFDMQAYDDFLNDRLPEVEYEDARLEEGLRSVPMEAPPAG
jgi:tryptophan synthase beta chain